MRIDFTIKVFLFVISGIWEYVLEVFILSNVQNMIRATEADKDLIVKILTSAFLENKSVNYIIRQDKFREKRIKALMEYSFDSCDLFGEIYLSEDRKACALVSFPDRKKIGLKSILLDMKLILRSTGVANISKVLTREKLISKNYPGSRIYYLWFIGVAPENQNRGFGKKLLAEIIADASRVSRTIYLETSTEKNLPWYEKAGFEIYNQLNFGYTLFLLKRKSGQSLAQQKK